MILLLYVFMKEVIKKLVPVCIMKALRQINSTALLHLNLGVRWRLLVNIMPVTLPTRKNCGNRLNRRLGWPQSSSG
jgi:hypothetical protein